MAGSVLVFGVVVLSMVVGNGVSSGAVHHVVGHDQGWDDASHVATWSIGRSFAVGDILWFAYSAAQESIAEVRSRAEYDSCDATNPIRMYTSGLNQVHLGREGLRYFVSSVPENCYNGLKLHVHVQPQAQNLAQGPVGPAADGPQPSGAGRMWPDLWGLIMWSCLVYPCLVLFIGFF